MKQSLKKFFLAAAISAAALTVSAEQKVGTVDLRKLFDATSRPGRPMPP